MIDKNVKGCIYVYAMSVAVIRMIAVEDHRVLSH